MIVRKINPFTMFPLPACFKYRIKFRKFFLEDGVFSYGYAEPQNFVDLYTNLTKGAADYVSPYAQYTLLSDDYIEEYVESLYTGKPIIHSKLIEEIERYHSPTEILNLLYHILYNVDRVEPSHIVLLFMYSALLYHVK